MTADLVTMVHPETGGRTSATREAFDHTWSALGWELAPDDDSPDGDEQAEDEAEVVEPTSEEFATFAAPVDDPIGAGLVTLEPGEDGSAYGAPAPESVLDQETDQDAQETAVPSPEE